MSNAKKDQNGKPSIICASKADGTTIVPLQADPTTHGLTVQVVTSGSDNGNNNGNAMVDENGVPVWTALASDGSGRIIEVYGDISTGALLIKSL